MFRILLVICSIPAFLVSQEPYADSAEAVVKKFFHALNTGDTLGISKLFGKEARIQTVYVNKEGKTVLLEETLTDLIGSLCAARKEKWEEKITKTEIILDYPLAIVNAFYFFYLDNKFSHCGVNVFQVIHNNGKWEIISLIDTRKRDKDKCKEK